MTNVIALSQLAQAAVVDAAQAAGAVPSALPPFSIGKVFTFLFLAIGPIKIIAPFAEMTSGRDARFKRELALRGTLYAAIGLLLAATSGASTLRSWGISVGALQLTAGLVLLLVALKPVLEQYAPRRTASGPAEPPTGPSDVKASRLAMSPLAFPTIVTPWGVAVLIMLVTLRGGEQSAAIQILLVTAGILIVNLLVMLSTERILKAALVRTGFGIMGLVLAILQVALGVQAMVGALPMLGLVPSSPAVSSAIMPSGTSPATLEPQLELRHASAAMTRPLEAAP